MQSLEPMRPGSLSLQRRKSGEESSGAYWHLSYTFQGRGHTEYIPAEFVSQIRREINAYTKLRRLLDKLIELSIMRSRMALKEAKARTR